MLQRYRVNPVSYSDHTRAMMLYLNGMGIIVFNRQCEMMNVLSEGRIDIKPATVVNWLDEFAVKSEGTRKQILKNVLSNYIVHVDESGLKVFTMKRGDPENGPLDLLKDYSNNVIHDHFVSYYTYLPHTVHCECNEHIRRYLKAGIDFNDSITCGRMIALLKRANERKKELIAGGHTCMDEKEL